MKRLLDTCFLILATLILSAQCPVLSAQNANQVLDRVFKKMQKVKDYSVDANIKVDMPFIRMLPSNAKVYYRQKGKLFKVDSKGISIIPKQGFYQLPDIIADTTAYATFIQGNEMVGKVNATIVNVIPESDTSDLILGKLWIDMKENVVLKSQLTTKSSGTILSAYTYGTQLAYGLPDLMEFTVDVKKFKMPKSLAADINKAEKQSTDKKEKEKKGKIYIKLTGYQVNKGVPDSVFKK